LFELVHHVEPAFDRRLRVEVLTDVERITELTRTNTERAYTLASLETVEAELKSKTVAADEIVAAEVRAMRLEGRLARGSPLLRASTRGPPVA
jgi:hypothetical protein